MSSETSVQLPVRLAPRRGQAVFKLLFMLFWCSFVVYWTIIFVPEFLSQNGVPSLGDFKPAHLMLLVPIVMLGFGIFALVRSILALLPGSPYVYLAFTRDGLTWRHFGSERQAAWSEIREFSLARERSGKSYKWVLLVNGVTSDRNGMPSDRNTATLFKIELGKFLSVFGSGREAKGLAAWFGALLPLADAGKLPQRLAFPESLTAGLLRPQDTPHNASTVATSAARRRSVIER